MECFECKKIISSDEVGMSKKLLGRNIKCFYCMDCLAKGLAVEKDVLLKKMEDFREEGCILFDSIEN